MKNPAHSMISENKKQRKQSVLQCFMLALLAACILIATNTIFHSTQWTMDDIDSYQKHKETFLQSSEKSNSHNATAIFETGDTGISACLLVMDDNHFLIEWLAYHSHVLPLHHLIVAVDPRSRTSPTSILERYQAVINITIWGDRDYYTANANERDEAEYWAERKFGSDIPRSLIQHRARQRLFYYHCMQNLKAAGREWTLLTDSDEFLRINYQTVQEVSNRPVESAEPVVPPISEAGSVLTFLQKNQHYPGFNLSTSGPCLQIPRIRFGTVEQSNANSSSDLIHMDTIGVNTSAMQTTRFRTHAKSGNYPLNRISKVLVNLRQVPWEDLLPVESIHLPIKPVCKRRKLHVRTHQQVLILHHYIGTWQQYSFRDDARAGNERSVQSYQKASNVDQETDDAIVPWIQGFVDHHGIATAQRFLKNVGEVHVPKLPQTTFINATELSPVELTTTHQQLKNVEKRIKAVRWLPTDQPTHSIQAIPLETNRTKAPLVLAEGVSDVEGDDEVAPPDKIDWDKAFP